MILRAAPGSAAVWRRLGITLRMRTKAASSRRRLFTGQHFCGIFVETLGQLRRGSSHRPCPTAAGFEDRSALRLLIGPIPKRGHFHGLPTGLQITPPPASESRVGGGRPAEVVG